MRSITRRASCCEFSVSIAVPPANSHATSRDSFETEGSVRRAGSSHTVRERDQESDSPPTIDRSTTPVTTSASAQRSAQSLHLLPATGASLNQQRTVSARQTNRGF